MIAPLPDLPSAFSAILDKIDRLLTDAHYAGPPIKMYLAGGLAVHHYCGTRHTNDIDASFSQRLLLPAKELVASYLNRENKPEPLYFDANYNPDFTLMHPDHRESAAEWTGLGNEKRKINSTCCHRFIWRSQNSPATPSKTGRTL